MHGATQDLSRARWLRARRLLRHAWSVRRALVLAARSSGRTRGAGLQPWTLRAQAPTRAPRGASGVAEPPNTHHEDFAVNLCTMGSASAAFLDRSDPPRAKTPYGTSPALRFNSASDASDATPAVPPGQDDGRRKGAGDGVYRGRTGGPVTTGKRIRPAGAAPPAHASAVGPDPGAANPVAGIALECTDPRARLGGRRSAGEPLRPLADVAQSSSCPVSSKYATWRTTIRTLDSKVVDLPNQLA